MADNPSFVPDTETRQRFINEIRDAVELLDYAIAQGRALADALIERIKKAQNYLADSAPWPSDAERADFETAYRDLAQFMQPITAATLRATQDRPGKNLWQSFFGASPAKRFSRRLYLLVILCVALMIASRIVVSYNPKVKDFGDPALPFMYGLLGSLVFLLRTCDTYLAGRTFDLYQAPTYYNRMLLGLVSGGVILLFVKAEDLVKSGGVGLNAVSFLVGYNTDYLFQTIERVAGAIFSKVKKEDPAAPPGIAKVDIPNPNVKAGASGNGTVVLTGAAPDSGIPVALAAAAEIKLASSSVSVSKGSTTANFTFTVLPTAAAGTQLTITAAANGTSASGSVTVG
jgi:hypothetical protein